MHSWIKNDISEVLVSEEQINNKVREMGQWICSDYKDKNPVLISILKGSVIFMADLMRSLNIKCSIDFMAVSSYRGNTETSGVVKLVMDLRETIEGRHVLLVEDIVDTGLTTAYLKENLLTRKPTSLKLCALLSKPDNRQVHIDIDYLGFEIPDKFVVGYGLDYREKYRHVPFIATLKPEVYRKNK